MAPIPRFTEAQLQQVCDVLGDTSDGLTGSEIGRLLHQCGVDDPEPAMTKRHRLFAALHAHQQRDGCGNIVAHFIQQALDPVRYTTERDVFRHRRDELNIGLAFCGLALGEDGKLRRTDTVATLDEAHRRASRLRAELERRRVHGDVLRFCRAELLRDNYFHAVLEATKSVADKIRDKAGLSDDGAALVDRAFGLGSNGIPLLACNRLQTDAERSEQRGLMNLMKGMFGTFRNPTAHAPRVHWAMDEQDAMDLLSLASLLHRRLDQAAKTDGSG